MDEDVRLNCFGMRRENGEFSDPHTGRSREASSYG
jgi:hypothetical protein